MQRDVRSQHRPVQNRVMQICIILKASGWREKASTGLEGLHIDAAKCQHLKKLGSEPSASQSDDTTLGSGIVSAVLKIKQGTMLSLGEKSF